MGACGRVGGSGRGSGLQHRRKHVAGVGWCCRVWGMWQGVGACGRVWGYVVGGQADGMDGDMWWGWGHVVGCGACGRVWGHVAGVGIW